MTRQSKAHEKALAPRESAFQRFADWVSDAMGRPTNIAFWAVLITIWTCIFRVRWPPSRWWHMAASLVHEPRIQLPAEPRNNCG